MKVVMIDRAIVSNVGITQEAGLKSGQYGHW